MRHGRNVFVSPGRDADGANSNTGPALSYLPWNIRGTFDDCRSGIFPRHGFRGHPSCDSPCGYGRKFESGLRHPVELEQP